LLDIPKIEQCHKGSYEVQSRGSRENKLQNCGSMLSEGGFGGMQMKIQTGLWEVKCRLISFYHVAKTSIHKVIVE